MGWETLAPVKGAPPKAPVRLGMRKAPKGRARISVIVEAAILERLGGGPFTIQIGTGAEAHHLRIAFDKQGVFTPKPVSSRGDKYVRFMLPPLDRLPDRQIDMAAADHTIDKTVMLIDMPSWAWLKKAA